MRRRRFIHGVAAAGTLLAAGCQELGPQSGDGQSDAGTTPAQTTDGGSGDSPGTTDTGPEALSVSWERGPDMPLRRTQTTAVALDDRLYVIGGIVDADTRHLAVYDPAAGEWSTRTPPPEPINHTSAVTLDGRIHVLGGYTGSFLGSDPRDVHWVYDPGTDEWSTGPALPTPRGALISLVIDDRIYAIGGADSSGTTDLVEVFDPDSGEWTTGPRLPSAREHLAGGVVEGRAYAVGGRQGLSPMLDATACLDPADGTGWRPRAEMPTARAGIAGAALGGFLFVFGGEEVGERVFEAVEAYHPPTDTWTTVAPLPTPRWGLGVARLDGRLFTVGGGAVPSSEETRRLEILSIE